MTPIFDTLLLEFELEWPADEDTRQNPPAGKRNEWFDTDATHGRG